MNRSSSVTELIEEILPTPFQAIVAFLISLGWILCLQAKSLVDHFAEGAKLTPTASHEVNLHVTHFLGLQIVGQVAIIIFWSIIGLIAYLIVWWLNNLLIGARNEVIITTSYTNQPRKGLIFIEPIMKTVFIALLVASVATIPYGLNFWLKLWQELLNSSFNWHGVLLAAGGVAGFAAELYLSFLFFQFAVNRFRG